MHPRTTHFIAASARDAALRRLRHVQRLVAVTAVALAAGFVALAQATTPAYQKHRAATVALATPDLRASPPAHRRRHRRTHHRTQHPKAAVASAPVTPAQPPVQSAPPPPAPAAPAQIQPPPAAPAPTPQPPVATSGGS
jgi:hypothetical protein